MLISYLVALYIFFFLANSRVWRVVLLPTATDSFPKVSGVQSPPQNTRGDFCILLWRRTCPLSHLFGHSSMSFFPLLVHISLIYTRSSYITYLYFIHSFRIRGIFLTNSLSCTLSFLLLLFLHCTLSFLLFLLVDVDTVQISSKWLPLFTVFALIVL